MTTTTTLPDAFTDAVASTELNAYRKGYRSFRAGRSRCPGELTFGACDEPVTDRRAPSGLPKVPSCKSMSWLATLKVELPDEVASEPHLAISPFRMRCTQSYCAEGGFRKGVNAPTPSTADTVARTTPGEKVAPSGASSGAPAGIATSTLLFVAVWYGSGAFTNSSSKSALASLPSSLPLTLTLVQHAAASFFGTIAYRGLGLRTYKPLPGPSEATPDALRSLLVLCAVYTVGFCLTNASFGAVNASFVDTVKAGEPITTVLLAVLFLANERVTVPVALSLLPIVGGVAISSMAEASASLMGLAFALGSNVCFSARSIAAKLVGKHMGSERMDGANLFVHVNRLGVLALLPAAVAIEGRTLFEFSQTLPAEQLVASLRLFAFNGLMYYLNNQMNFLVLEKVDTLTHGIINCGRRVANILFAIVYFGNKVTFFNGTGISLALLGGFLYVRTKMAEARAKAKLA